MRPATPFKLRLLWALSIAIFCTAGQATVADNAAPDDPAAISVDGQAVYAARCASCHDSGLSLKSLMTRAPRIGSAYWTIRLEAVGFEALVAATLQGRGRMPPQGGAGGVNPAEAEAAVQYLLQSSQADD